MNARKPRIFTSLMASAAMCVSLAAAVCTLPTAAAAQFMDPYLGEVRFIAGNALPFGWQYCDGQELQINSNQALFHVIGTLYGGDARKTFSVPDARGRALAYWGYGPGLPNLRIAQLSPASANLLAGTQVAASMPWLAVRCIIAVYGQYPSRN